MRVELLLLRGQLAGAVDALVAVHAERVVQALDDAVAVVVEPVLVPVAGVRVVAEAAAGPGQRIATLVVTGLVAVIALERTTGGIDAADARRGLAIAITIVVDVVGRAVGMAQDAALAIVHTTAQIGRLLAGQVRAVAVLVDRVAADLGRGLHVLNALDGAVLAGLGALGTDALEPRVAGRAATGIALVDAAIAVVVEAVAGLVDGLTRLGIAGDAEMILGTDVGTVGQALTEAEGTDLPQLGEGLVGLAVAVVVELIAQLLLRLGDLDANDAILARAAGQTITADAGHARVTGLAAARIVVVDRTVAVVVATVANVHLLDLAGIAAVGVADEVRADIAGIAHHVAVVVGLVDVAAVGAVVAGVADQITVAVDLLVVRDVGTVVGHAALGALGAVGGDIVVVRVGHALHGHADELVVGQAVGPPVLAEPVVDRIARVAAVIVVDVGLILVGDLVAVVVEVAHQIAVRIPAGTLAFGRTDRIGDAEAVDTQLEMLGVAGHAVARIAGHAQTIAVDVQLLRVVVLGAVVAGVGEPVVVRVHAVVRHVRAAIVAVRDLVAVDVTLAGELTGPVQVAVLTLGTGQLAVAGLEAHAGRTHHVRTAVLVGLAVVVLAAVFVDLTVAVVVDLIVAQFTHVAAPGLVQVAAGGAAVVLAGEGVGLAAEHVARGEIGRDAVRDAGVEPAGLAFAAVRVLVATHAASRVIVGAETAVGRAAHVPRALHHGPPDRPAGVLRLGAGHLAAHTLFVAAPAAFGIAVAVLEALVTAVVLEVADAAAAVDLVAVRVVVAPPVDGRADALPGLGVDLGGLAGLGLARDVEAAVVVVGRVAALVVAAVRVEDAPALGQTSAVQAVEAVGADLLAGVGRVAVAGQERVVVPVRLAVHVHLALATARQRAGAGQQPADEPEGHQDAGLTLGLHRYSLLLPRRALVVARNRPGRCSPTHLNEGSEKLVFLCTKKTKRAFETPLPFFSFGYRETLKRTLPNVALEGRANIALYFCFVKRRTVNIRWEKKFPTSFSFYLISFTMEIKYFVNFLFALRQKMKTPCSAKLARG